MKEKLKQEVQDMKTVEGTNVDETVRSEEKEGQTKKRRKISKKGNGREN